MKIKLDKKKINEKLDRIHRLSRVTAFELGVENPELDWNNIVFYVNRIKKSVEVNSILLDIDYGKLHSVVTECLGKIKNKNYDAMVSLVDELYGDLDIHNIATYNKRKFEEVKKKVATI